MRRHFDDRRSGIDALYRISGPLFLIYIKDYADTALYDQVTSISSAPARTLTVQQRPAGCPGLPTHSAPLIGAIKEK
jgi:hypothetical protein